MSSIKILRINKENYAKFLEMIHYRITGLAYGEESKRDIVSENIDYAYILENDNFYVYSALIDNKMVGYLAAGIIPWEKSNIHEQLTFLYQTHFSRKTRTCSCRRSNSQC